MRISIVIVLALLSVAVSVCSHQLSFEEGWVSCAWSEDLQSLTLAAAVEVTTATDESPLWVVTAYGHRFEDGIFAWQIHYSETVDSILIIPNDFLTSRHFSTPQLGIEVALTDEGRGLIVQIPAAGSIPRLIAPGDQIELHALWVKQEPLISLLVPDPSDVASLEAGGGASAPETEPSSAITPLPELVHYEQGVPIAHQFTLPANNDPTLPDRLVLSYTLMRVHPDGPDEFARFAHIPYDSDTGVYSYFIDTSNLPPGIYRLLIGSATAAQSYQLEIEILSPTP